MYLFSDTDERLISPDMGGCVKSKHQVFFDILY